MQSGVALHNAGSLPVAITEEVLGGPGLQVQYCSPSENLSNLRRSGWLTQHLGRSSRIKGKTRLTDDKKAI